MANEKIGTDILTVDEFLNAYPNYSNDEGNVLIYQHSIQEAFRQLNSICNSKLLNYDDYADKVNSKGVSIQWLIKQALLEQANHCYTSNNDFSGKGGSLTLGGMSVQQSPDPDARQIYKQICQAARSFLEQAGLINNFASTSPTYLKEDCDCNPNYSLNELINLFERKFIKKVDTSMKNKLIGYDDRGEEIGLDSSMSLKYVSETEEYIRLSYYKNGQVNYINIPKNGGQGPDIDEYIQNIQFKYFSNTMDMTIAYFKDDYKVESLHIATRAFLDNYITFVEENNTLKIKVLQDDGTYLESPTIPLTFPEPVEPILPIKTGNYTYNQINFLGDNVYQCIISTALVPELVALGYQYSYADLFRVASYGANSLLKTDLYKHYQMLNSYTWTYIKEHWDEPIGQIGDADETKAIKEAITISAKWKDVLGVELWNTGSTQIPINIRFQAFNQTPVYLNATLGQPLYELNEWRTKNGQGKEFKLTTEDDLKSATSVLCILNPVNVLFASSTYFTANKTNQNRDYCVIYNNNELVYSFNLSSSDPIATKSGVEMALLNENINFDFDGYHYQFTSELFPSNVSINSPDERIPMWLYDGATGNSILLSAWLRRERSNTNKNKIILYYGQNAFNNSGGINGVIRFPVKLVSKTKINQAGT